METKAKEKIKKTAEKKESGEKKVINKGGRPRKIIDTENFEKLCGLQCTLAEIAAFFCVSEDTIERWCKRNYKESFAAVWAQKRQAGFISIRRAMFQKATVKQDTALLIFLSKNFLGLSDQPMQDADRETLKKVKDLLDGVESCIK